VQDDLKQPTWRESPDSWDMIEEPKLERNPNLYLLQLRKERNVIWPFYYRVESRESAIDDSVISFEIRILRELYKSSEHYALPIKGLTILGFIHEFYRIKVIRGSKVGVLERNITNSSGFDFFGDVSRVSMRCDRASYSIASIHLIRYY